MAPRVLHLVEYLFQGGIERFLSEIGRFVPEKHLQQIFFAYEMTDFEGAAKELKQSGNDIRIYKKDFGYDFKLLGILSRIVKEENIEIIHTHDFGPIEYATALKIRHPKIVLIHTQHTLHHFITNIKYLLFFQFASYFYSKMIAVSAYVKDVIGEKCKCMKGEMTIIHNGVDIDRYCSLRQNIAPDNVLRLICISRISQEKNFAHILRTCRQLKERKINFQLHHAGTGTPKEVEPILRFIENNQLTNDVTMHGFQNDIRNVLGLGDIFISSSFTEGHPIAVLEAMASGKLCICSNIPSHKNISPHGILLFKLDDENDLLNKLLDIKSKKINGDEKVTIAKKDVDEKYSIQKMISSYINIYNTSAKQKSLPFVV